MITLILILLIITNIGTIILGCAFIKQRKAIAIMLNNITNMQNTISNGLEEIRTIQSRNKDKQSKQFN